MEQTEVFVYFELDDQIALVETNIAIPVKSFKSFESYLASGAEASGFAVGTKNADSAQIVLRELRGRPETSTKPIYLLTSLGDELDHISDGVVGSLDEAYERSREIGRRIDNIDPEIFTDNDGLIFRLLGYLYARPNSFFEPLRQWAYPGLYSYPVVDAIISQDENSEIWLRRLVDRGLARNAELIDRVRLCPGCEWAHLNYVDTCANCSSIDITQKPFLHCFTCGHVAPEEDYLLKGLLSCPNCTTRLRHIGADYDRALENYMCKKCGHVFAEPEVVAHCQHCGNKNDPQDLLPRSIHKLGITDRGSAAVKSGMLEDVYALLDSLNNINPIHFESLIDWLLALCQRYADELFSLIGIRFDNILELNEKIGRRRVIELMDGFSERIREIIRSTDLTTRTSRQNFWIILPKTDIPGCKVVLDRISNIKTYSKQKEGIGIEFKTNFFNAPQDVHKGESAQMLLARLEGGMQ